MSNSTGPFFSLHLFFILPVYLFFCRCFLPTYSDSRNVFHPVPSQTDVWKLFPKVCPPNCITEKMPALELCQLDSSNIKRHVDSLLERENKVKHAKAAYYLFKGKKNAFPGFCLLFPSSNVISSWIKFFPNGLTWPIRYFSPLFVHYLTAYIYRLKTISTHGLLGS